MNFQSPSIIIRAEPLYFKYFGEFCALEVNLFNSFVWNVVRLKENVILSKHFLYTPGI